MKSLNLILFGVLSGLESKGDPGCCVDNGQ